MIKNDVSHHGEVYNLYLELQINFYQLLQFRRLGFWLYQAREQTYKKE